MPSSQARLVDQSAWHLKRTAQEFRPYTSGGLGWNPAGALPFRMCTTGASMLLIGHLSRLMALPVGRGRPTVEIPGEEHLKPRW